MKNVIKILTLCCLCCSLAHANDTTQNNINNLDEKSINTVVTLYKDTLNSTFNSAIEFLNKTNQQAAKNLPLAIKNACPYYSTAEGSFDLPLVTLCQCLIHSSINLKIAPGKPEYLELCKIVATLYLLTPKIHTILFNEPITVIDEMIKHEKVVCDDSLSVAERENAFEELNNIFQKWWNDHRTDIDNNPLLSSLFRPTSYELILNFATYQV